MSSPAVVSVVMNTYWPQDHGIKIFKYGTLPLVSIETMVHLPFPKDMRVPSVLATLVRMVVC